LEQILLESIITPAHSPAMVFSNAPTIAGAFLFVDF
jgi:hypothetical protein